MTFSLVPSSDFRYSLRRDDRGTDVAALQINLPGLIVDGHFGARTERAVTDWQTNMQLLALDGIAGPATQASIVSECSKLSERQNNLPTRILKSIASNESGLFVTSCGPHSVGQGWDIGAYARSSGDEAPTQEFLYSAYDVEASASWTALNLLRSRQRVKDPVKSRYLEAMAHGNRRIFEWQLAILAHNWPGNPDTGRGGAIGISNHGEATDDDDAPAQWIIDATRGRLHTPYEWVLGYVARATVYVKWSKE